MPEQRKRTRETTASLEAKQFTTLRTVPASEAVSAARKPQFEPAASKGSSLDFDPVKTDPMFTIVENSKYWPPPSVDEVLKARGMKSAGRGETLNADGMDTYDRRADNAKARKQRVPGELRRPRGLTTKNSKVVFDD